MTKNTHKRIQRSDEKCYLSVQSLRKSVMALTGVLLLGFGAISPTYASEQVAIITGTGFSVQPTTTVECQDKLICRLEKLKDLIKNLDIEFEIEIDIYILKMRVRFKLSPKDKVELGAQLSQLETRLMQEDKLSPVIKSELKALLVLVNQV